MEDPKMRVASPRVEGSCGARASAAAGGGVMRHWIGQRHCRWVLPSSPHGVTVALVIVIVVAAARVEAQALHAATAVAGTPSPLLPSGLLVGILTLNREVSWEGGEIAAGNLGVLIVVPLGQCMGLLVLCCWLVAMGRGGYVAASYPLSLFFIGVVVSVVSIQVFEFV